MESPLIESVCAEMSLRGYSLRTEKPTLSGSGCSSALSVTVYSTPLWRNKSAPGCLFMAGRQQPIQLVGEGLPVAVVEAGRAAGVDAAGAHLIHEVPHRQPLESKVKRVCSRIITFVIYKHYHWMLQCEN